MRIFCFLLLSLLIISCKGNHTSNDTNSSKNDTLNGANQDKTPGWIDSFREFRDAVYHGDKARVKQFIDFPIMNYNNEIWYLTNTEAGSKNVIPSDSTVPFTEKDFDKYFNQIFPKRFITTILKIKSEELYKTGVSRTEEFEAERDTNTVYSMEATLDKEQKLLSLSILQNTTMRDDKGEVLDGGESAIIYQFDILNDGKIKFRQVRIAG